MARAIRLALIQLGSPPHSVPALCVIGQTRRDKQSHTQAIQPVDPALGMF